MVTATEKTWCFRWNKQAYWVLVTANTRGINYREKKRISTLPIVRGSYENTSYEPTTKKKLGEDRPKSAKNSYYIGWITDDISFPWTHPRTYPALMDGTKAQHPRILDCDFHVFFATTRQEHNTHVFWICDFHVFLQPRGEKNICTKKKSFRI